MKSSTGMKPFSSLMLVVSSPTPSVTGRRPTAERRIDASRVLVPEGVSMVTFTPLPPGSTFCTLAESS